MDKFVKKLRGDGAGSELVSMLFIIAFFLPVMISIMEFSLWGVNRSQVSSIARDGARAVAIVGGNGTESQSTQLEGAYGLPPSVCNNVPSKTASTPIECNLYNALNNTKGLIAVKIDKVHCTPIQTGSIGSRTTCTVEYTYYGIPGSPLSIFKNSETGKRALEHNVMTGTSSAEVRDVPLIPRG